MALMARRTLRTVFVRSSFDMGMCVAPFASPLKDCIIPSSSTLTVLRFSKSSLDTGAGIARRVEWNILDAGRCDADVCV